MITKQMACVWSLGILGGTVALAEATGTNSASTAPATAAVNLLPNGDFQQVTAAGGLAGWTPDQWLTYKVLDDGDGNRFARFTTTAPAQFPAAHHELPLDPACVRLTVAARTRAAATRGREAWHYPRVEVQFTGPDGQKVPVADGHPVIEVTGGKADQWADRSVHVAVPPGAARLRLGMGIWGAVGTADFDDLRVVPRYLGDDAKAGEPPQVPLSARQLLDAGRHDEAAALAERQLLLAAGAGRPDLVEDLAKLRARALRLGGKPQEALAAAKRYYNVCRMARTADAVTTVSECLRAAYPGDVRRLQRFRAEQTADASAAGTQVAAAGGAEAAAAPAAPAGTVLGSVELDPQPYADAAAKRDGGRFADLLAKGDLLLLAGRAEEAKAAFEAAYAAAPEERVAEAVEGIARSMRAADGSVGRANAWVLSLQQ